MEKDRFTSEQGVRFEELAVKALRAESDEWRSGQHCNLRQIRLIYNIGDDDGVERAGQYVKRLVQKTHDMRRDKNDDGWSPLRGVDAARFRDGALVGLAEVKLRHANHGRALGTTYETFDLHDRSTIERVLVVHGGATVVAETARMFDRVWHLDPTEALAPRPPVARAATPLVPNLHAYQRECVDTLVAHVTEEGARLLALQLPPGAGKTFVMLTFLREVSALDGQGVVYVIACPTLTVCAQVIESAHKLGMADRVDSTTCRDPNVVHGELVQRLGQKNDAKIVVITHTALRTLVTHAPVVEVGHVTLLVDEAHHFVAKHDNQEFLKKTRCAVAVSAHVPKAFKAERRVVRPHRALLETGVLVPICLELPVTPREYERGALEAEADLIVGRILAHNQTRALVAAPSLTTPELDEIARHVQRRLVAHGHDDPWVRCQTYLTPREKNLREEFRAARGAAVLLSLRQLMEGFDDPSLVLVIVAGPCPKESLDLFQACTRSGRAHEGKHEGRVCLLHPDTDLVATMIARHDADHTLFHIECENLALEDFVSVHPEARAKRLDATRQSDLQIRKTSQHVLKRSPPGSTKRIDALIHFLCEHFPTTPPAADGVIDVRIPYQKQRDGTFVLRTTVRDVVSELCDVWGMIDRKKLERLRALLWLDMSGYVPASTDHVRPLVWLTPAQQKTFEWPPSDEAVIQHLRAHHCATGPDGRGSFLQVPAGGFHLVDGRLVNLRAWLLLAYLVQGHDRYAKAPPWNELLEEGQDEADFVRRLLVPSGGAKDNRTETVKMDEERTDAEVRLRETHADVLGDARLMYLVYDHVFGYCTTSCTQNTVKTIEMAFFGHGVSFRVPNSSDDEDKPLYYHDDREPLRLSVDVHALCEWMKTFCGRTDMVEGYVCSKLRLLQRYLLRQLHMWHAGSTRCPFPLTPPVFVRPAVGDEDKVCSVRKWRRIPWDAEAAARAVTSPELVKFLRETLVFVGDGWRLDKFRNMVPALAGWTKDKCVLVKDLVPGDETGTLLRPMWSLQTSQAHESTVGAKSGGKGVEKRKRGDCSDEDEAVCD